MAAKIPFSFHYIHSHFKASVPYLIQFPDFYALSLVQVARAIQITISETQSQESKN